jgi:hypothetical protein
MKFSELDGVKTLKNFSEHGIQKGDIGTVIIAFTVPNEAYEVEFVDETGVPRATFPILPEDLESINIK